MQNPIMVGVGVSLAGIIFWLLLAPQYTPPKKAKKYSTEDEDERIAAWQPKPIVPTTFNPDVQQVATPIVVKSSAGAVVVDENDVEYLNFASANYLGLSSLPVLKEVARETIKEYGVGSCGPRGFYGTIDLHLQLEKTWSNFMGSSTSILYSDGLACLSSVIPAFSKATDFIVVDEAVHCGIQQGLKLSRSKITRFDHNDINALEKCLQQNDFTLSAEDKLKYRRFIIVESIYQKTGEVCPLDKVVALAKKYKFRVILDDSNAVGVLGKTGRGALEHFNLKLVDDVEIVCTTLDTALSSVGGLCIGSSVAVSHQRLSGSGYCFSAASPPYTAKVATHAIGLLDANPSLVQLLRQKSSIMYKSFKALNNLYDVHGNELSPIVVLRPAVEALQQWAPGVNKEDPKAASKHPQLYEKLKQIAALLRSDYRIICSVQHRAPQEEAYPYGLKFSVTTLHSDDDITYLTGIVKQVTQKVLAQ